MSNTRANDMIDAYRYTVENRARLAAEEKAKQQAVKEANDNFYSRYYNASSARQRNEANRARLMEGARDAALSTVLKAIYMTALEAESLTDDGVLLGESMVDNWIQENGGASKILSKVGNDSYLLSRITQIVEDAAEKSTDEIENKEDEPLDDITDDGKVDAGTEGSEDKKENSDEEKVEDDSSSEDNQDAVDSVKDVISNASKEELKDVSDDIKKAVDDRKKELKDEKEAEKASEEADKAHDKAEKADEKAEKAQEKVEKNEAKKSEDQEKAEEESDNSEEGEPESKDESEDEKKDASEEESDDEEGEPESKDEDSKEEDNSEEEKSDDEEKSDPLAEVDEDEIVIDDEDDDDDESDDNEDDDDDSDEDEEEVNIDGEDPEEDKDNGEIFDQLSKEEDVKKAIDLIRSRVADAEQTFIKNNAEDKKKVDELLDKIAKKVKTVEDLNEEDKKAKVAQESIRFEKRKIDSIRDNRPLTVFEAMTRKFSSAVLRDEHLKEQYITESGALDTELIVESAKVMYGFLETINTLQLAKVDTAYIKNIIDNM